MQQRPSLICEERRSDRRLLGRRRLRSGLMMMALRCPNAAAAGIRMEVDSGLLRGF